MKQRIAKSPFTNGSVKPANSGRKPGSVNQLTKSAKEAHPLAFEAIGGVEAFAEWASKNRTDFYKLYARLIPHEVQAATNAAIELPPIEDLIVIIDALVKDTGKVH